MVISTKAKVSQSYANIDWISVFLQLKRETNQSERKNSKIESGGGERQRVEVDNERENKR